MTIPERFIYFGPTEFSSGELDYDPTLSLNDQPSIPSSAAEYFALLLHVWHSRTGIDLITASTGLRARIRPMSFVLTASCS
jgi:hypothetical protein